MTKNGIKIGVVGLGYVGFPLACLFARKYDVVAFDVREDRVRELVAGNDTTLEVPAETIRAAFGHGMRCTADSRELSDCNVYIVAVPTPVDERHHPDLSPLAEASRLVGGVASRGDIVIFESTVYPGTTEEYCAPLIEKESGLKLNEDFFLGYSPERVNPGDKVHTVENILKITSGSTPETAERVDRLYNSVLKNGTHRAPTIRVAEAAKLLENTQRDVNIALMNEVAMVFNSLDIDTRDVLEAAGTKWNFLRFSPGLVGGHCISVDPYYFINKAVDKGLVPRLMTEARRINDGMGRYVADRVVSLLRTNGLCPSRAAILLLGFTFKENCPDMRNTKVLDIYRTLTAYTSDVRIYDPWVDPEAALRAYGVRVETSPEAVEGRRYDAVVACVSHEVFRNLPLSALLKPGGVLYDVKGQSDRSLVTERL